MRRRLEPPVRIFWDPDLRRTKGYYWPNPAEIGLSPWLLPSEPLEEQRQVLLEEIGHHLSMCLYDPKDETFVGLSRRQWCEARGERAGMRWWVDDDAVERAIAAGCRRAWQFAERWGIPVDWAERRLVMYCARHPWRRVA